MTAPAPQSQPSSRELVTTLRDMRTPLAIAAADRIEYLEATEANKIATLTARVETLEKTIKLASYALRKASLTDNERIADAQIALGKVQP